MEIACYVKGDLPPYSVPNGENIDKCLTEISATRTSNGLSLTEDIGFIQQSSFGTSENKDRKTW
jgi:hypothetical protein